MTAPNPGQMTDHMLNPAKGWPHEAALDFQAKISANVLYALQPGQVCHLNSAGELEPGVQLGEMALFIFQGANDLDVNNAQGFNRAGISQWTPISPSGRVMCLPAKGAYELETTEFDTTQVYAPNDYLRAPLGNNAGDYANGSGQLTNQGVGTMWSNAKAVCGVVSRGALTNAYGSFVLAFWPVYVPSPNAG